MPVRYYSAGMMIRLAFAIATASEPEILIVDEVLSVGDLAFQQKASQRIREMMAQARLMVIVSHDLQFAGRTCARGSSGSDHGRLRQIGPPAETIAAYQAARPAGRPRDMESRPPCASVIVVNFNGRRFLAECLTALERQTCRGTATKSC